MERTHILSWMKKRISQEIDGPEEKIMTNIPIASFDIDSLSMIEIAADFEKFTGREIDPTIFWEFETIDQLTDWILEQPK